MYSDKTVARTSWYLRKVAEASKRKSSERKIRRLQRLVCYKNALRKKISKEKPLLA